MIPLPQSLASPPPIAPHYALAPSRIRPSPCSLFTSSQLLIENISQTQIDEDGPYDYAMWARGILRQAPDIVMM
jgi:hypothetical protein